MTTLKITDLETSTELDREAMIAVSGGMGFNSISQGGMFAPVANAGGGFSFASPTTIVSTPINVPVAISLDLDSALDIDNQVSSLVGSSFSGIVQ
ncbi:MAG: hypothetical protein ABF290_11120 [Thiogranum sp.]